MPNWAYNELKITGTNEALNRIQKALNTGTSEDQRMRLAAAITDNPAKQAEISESLKSNAEQEFSFTAHKPEPGIATNMSLGDSPSYDWYTWRTKNWGTKWDAGSITVERDDKTLTYTFDTAWGAPLEWFDTFLEAETDVNATLTHTEEQTIWIGKLGRINGENFSDYKKGEPKELLKHANNNNYTEFIINYLENTIERQEEYEEELRQEELRQEENSAA